MTSRRLVHGVLALAALALAALPAAARLRLPDHIYYGSVSDGGLPVESGSIAVTAGGSPIPLASFEYPSPPDPNTLYVLRIPLDDGQIPQLAGTARTGDTVQFLLDGVQVGSAVLGAQGLATRLDLGDQPPALSVNDVKLGLSGSDPVLAVFTLRLSRSVSFPVSVAYATADGSATAGQDYTAASGTATVLAGQTTTTVSIKVNGGSLSGEQETFFLDLSSPQKAMLSDARGLCVLTNESLLSARELVAREDASAASRAAVALRVELSAPSKAEVLVDYATADGSASAGSDFLAASGTLVFPAGQTSQSIALVLLDDVQAEGTEHFSVRFTNIRGGVLAQSEARVSILDDETALHDQIDRFATTAIRSVLPTADLAAFEAQASDDFTLTKPATVKAVEVLGRYGFDPGASPRMRVQFFEAASAAGGADGGAALGVPGRLLRSFEPVPASVLSGGGVTLGSGEPVLLSLALPEPLSLEPGTYWLSVQALVGRSTERRWYWVYQATGAGALFTYRNPGNGYAEGCLAWAPGLQCPGVPGKSLSFRLVGSETPTVPAHALPILACAGLLALVLARRRRPRP